jgi:hypothetical protein
VTLLRRTAGLFCSKSFLWVIFAASLYAPCQTERPSDFSGEWEANPVDFLARTRLWAAAQLDGGIKVFLYAPHEDSEPAPVTSATLQGSTLTLSIEQLRLSYTGRLSSDGNSIKGFCTFDNQSRGLDFHRTVDTHPATIQELEQMLGAAHGKSDAQIAALLQGVRLSERLSTPRLFQLEANLPRPEARQALIALADSSAFLDPPAEEVPSLEKPDTVAQDKMLALAADYVAQTIHRLPNLTATRSTTSYHRKLRPNESWGAAGRSHALVFYRDGRETQRSSAFEVDSDLTTHGEFGPILTTVMHDSSKNNIMWSHWERGEKGPIAVFRYQVDASHSHYQVQNGLSGYGAEISIDPADGSIFRVALRADMEPANPHLVADLMIEYGPEVLGDKVYICPRRGVAVSLDLREQRVNDVVFDSYHLFHATTRILPGSRPIE